MTGKQQQSHAATVVDLVELLIREQWAAPWTGVGPKPVPPWPRTITQGEP